MTKEQIDLARFVDAATGAINRQTTAVQRLAAAQARQGEVESGTKTYTTARSQAISAARDAAGVRDPVFTAGFRQPDAIITDPLKKRIRDLAAAAAAGKLPINDFALAIRGAVGDRPEYRALVKTVTAQAAAAVTAAQGVQLLKAEQAVLTGTATAQQKALLGLGQVTTGLIDKQVALATATTATERARASLALVEERGRNIRAGDTKALATYRTDLTAATRAVQQAEAAEKSAAEAKREGAKASRDAARDAKRAAREQEQAARAASQAERELLSIRSDLLVAKSDLTSDKGMQDSFARQRIELERAGRVSELEERRRRGEITDVELTERKKLASEIADARAQLVTRNRSIQDATDEVERARAGIDGQRDLLDAQASLATTTAQRRDIELKLLDLSLEERRIQAQKVVDLAAAGKATEQERVVAQMTLDNLRKLRSVGQAGIERQYQGAAAQYREDLAGDINEQLEAIEVNAVRKLEDGLVDSAKAALGLSGALGDVVGQLIRVGIQRRLIGPLADALFGPASGAEGGSGGGGALGAVTAAVGRALGGRASGGYVAPGQTVRVNEHKGGVELLRMGSQGGTVIPLGAANAVARPAGSGAIVHQHFALDMRGAMTFPEFVQQIQTYVNAKGQEAAGVGASAALKQMPVTLAAHQRFKG